MSEENPFSYQRGHPDGNQDPHPQQSSPVSVSKADADDPLDFQGTTNVSVSSVSSLLIHTRSPTPTSVDSGDESVEGDNIVPATIHTVTRTLKRPQIVYLRPAVLGAQTLKVPSARIVSLPETVSKYSAKQETSRRVVSMPRSGPMRLNTYSAQFNTEESPARGRVRSITTDLPHTPSPPSSPDSVVFIANRSPLPEGFLRKNTRIQEVHTPELHEDQDYVPWGSPPRPIPALHGPLSLPYARCPSGAEGTIIEEQENLPGMIWGLEGENTGHRRRAKNDPAEKQHAAQASNKRTNFLEAVQSVPSRFNSQSSFRKDDAVTPVPPTLSIRNQLLTPEIEPQMIPSQPQIKTGSPDFYYGLSSRGPIDLGDFMRTRTDLLLDLYTKDLGLANKSAWGSTGDSLYNYGSSGDSSWQSILLAQERLRNALPTFPGNISRDHPRTSASVGSLASLSSRSPIVLDTQVPASRSVTSLRSPFVSQYATPILHTPSTSHGAPRRLSALEIAQNFRQQQQQPQKQQQTMLPTPPSSSSPLWSPQFPPYQEALLSPEFLAAARMPGGVSLRDVEAQRLALLQQAEALRKLHSHLGVSSRDPQGSMFHQTSVPRLQDHLGDALDAPLAGNAACHTSVGGLYLHPQQAPAPPVSNPLPVMNPHRSPIGPSLPSSTRFGPVGSRVPPRTPALGSNIPASPAPSPDVSQQRTRNISQQGPRSIPLARLVQRLSSVPEEDSTTLPDKGRMSSGVADHASGGPTQRAPTDKRAQPIARAFNSLNENGKTRKKTEGGTNAPSARPGSRGDSSRHAAEDKAAHVPLETPTEFARSAGAGGREENSAPREPSPGRGRRTNNRGRGGGRGTWRARRSNAVNGPERSEGGLIVRS